MRILAIIILSTALLCSSISTAGDGFRRPFKKGDYYEFMFVDNGIGGYRYSGRVIHDTLIERMYVSTVQIYDEPPLGNYTITYKFDTVSLKLYGGTSTSCPDSNGNYLAAGFNLPIGFIWDTCTNNNSRNMISDTGSYSQMLLSGIPLRFVERKDTIGAPVDISSVYVFYEMFGFAYFGASSGSPFGNHPYYKAIDGAVIDGVTYGTIVLSVNQISSEIPNGYSLSQNYPNPFNPATTISFDIPIKENVRLVVYDQLGREVRELVSETLSPGSYQYKFTANNLPSGLYYYTLQTGNYSQTKKMLLVK